MFWYQLGLERFDFTNFVLLAIIESFHFKLWVPYQQLCALCLMLLKLIKLLGAYLDTNLFQVIVVRHLISFKGWGPGRTLFIRTDCPVRKEKVWRKKNFHFSSCTHSLYVRVSTAERDRWKVIFLHSFFINSIFLLLFHSIHFLFHHSTFNISIEK